MGQLGLPIDFTFVDIDEDMPEILLVEQFQPFLYKFLLLGILHPQSGPLTVPDKIFKVLDSGGEDVERTGSNNRLIAFLQLVKSLQLLFKLILIPDIFDALAHLKDSADGRTDHILDHR